MPLHEFSVWAPLADRMTVVVDPAGVGESGVQPASVAMDKGDGGWWHASVTADSRAPDYGFLIDDDPTVRPDPASRHQPRGVHEPSRVFDPAAHVWRDANWAGKPIAGGVIYELHVGTFTPEGTLDAASGHFDRLRQIGVTHVELLPVNAFAGTHNWGYDGVGWYAVHEQYGGPAAYQRFVDAAHAAGLAVVQDVVYNHLGPSGNYLPLFGPYLSTESRSTWGEHVNLAEPEVRRFILDNLRFWFRDMHVDALRLDAVHALVDASETHILEEMAIETQALAAHLGRSLQLIAESDQNDPRLVTPREAGGVGIDAQWSDDFHHAVHVALTGETNGYYADFAPLSALAKVLEGGFFHDGTFSSFRGREHGGRIDAVHALTWRLVVAAQNHDQVGNRARGDRPSEVLTPSQLLCAALLLYAGPFTPMLFQGEEWGAKTPFQFFTAHEEELGRLTRDGRLSEFAEMGWDPAVVPDPQDPATFERSKLNWAEAEGGDCAGILAGYRQLAALRRELAALTDPSYRVNSVTVDEAMGVLRLVRRAGSSDAVEVVINFGQQSQTLSVTKRRLRFATDAAIVPPASGALTLPPGTGALLD